MAQLLTLRVRNLVIIEDVTVELGPGLNLLTGETGAGKSMLVDALGLAAGSRSDRSSVRTGADTATVEVLFDVREDVGLQEWATEHGFPPFDDGQLLIRREISSSGTGRAHVNGSPCTVAMLRQLGERLLELHRQHQQKSLIASGSHQELLDRFGGHEAAAARVSSEHAAVMAARERLLRLQGLAAERDEKLARLQREIREIDELEPVPDELEALECERRILQNAERMAELLDDVVATSYEGEHAAAAQAAVAANRAEELAALDPSLEELASRIRAAALELQDAGGGFREYRERRDFDLSSLELLEDRRATLQRLCLSYGVDEAGLLDHRGRAREELSELESIAEDLEAAGNLVNLAEVEYLKAAGALTRKRKAAADKLETAVQAQLGALAMAKARFTVDRSVPRGEKIQQAGQRPQTLTAGGAERIEFLLSANPGEPPRPLGQVASGGELSRVMLALHVVNENADPGRVLVFDEIDAGVGGAVADAVGARLGRLARNAQVLCVTHLPQIAAYADRHFSVTKTVESGRTTAGIESLSRTKRVEELARMLGGRRPTAASRRHASELLSAAGRRPRVQPRGTV